MWILLRILCKTILQFDADRWYTILPANFAIMVLSEDADLEVTIDVFSYTMECFEVCAVETVLGVADLRDVDEAYFTRDSGCLYVCGKGEIVGGKIGSGPDVVPLR